MNCASWGERIALHAGGDLAEADAAEVERHLAACAPCREFAAELKASLGLLREAHGEEIAPAHFAAVRARVLAQVGKKSLKPTQAGMPVPLWAGMGLAAAAALLAIGFWPRPVPVPRVVWDRPPGPSTVPAIVVGEGRRPVLHRRRRTVRHGPAPPRHEQLVVKLVTDDPNVVIYWIADEGDY